MHFCNCFQAFYADFSSCVTQQKILCIVNIGLCRIQLSVCEVEIFYVANEIIMPHIPIGIR